MMDAMIEHCVELINKRDQTFQEARKDQEETFQEEVQEETNGAPELRKQTSQEVVESDGLAAHSPRNSWRSSEVQQHKKGRDYKGDKLFCTVIPHNKLQQTEF